MALTQKVIEIHKEVIEHYLSGGEVWWESMIGWQVLGRDVKIEELFFADMEYKTNLDTGDIHLNDNGKMVKYGEVRDA